MTAAAPPVRLAIDSVAFYMRNVRMRLPFRYGKACLVAAPLLHVRLVARGENGRTVEATSADMLPPKWFDKSPDKSFARNVSDLILAARTGAQAYLAVGSRCLSPFDIWLEAHPLIQDAARLVGLNSLTACFGSSIIERAMIDAACRLAHADFHTLTAANSFGVEPAQVHSELNGCDIAKAISPGSRQWLFVRHTVGMADPIFDADIPPAERLDDGIPQSVEAWITAAGVRYFKIKVSAAFEADRTRLARIASLLDAALPGQYRLTLDGNEQFPSMAVLRHWYQAMQDSPDLHNLLGRVLFIEQPVERGAALSERGVEGIREANELPPIIIDESDDHLDAFKRAAALGYRGVSAKNCKGVFPALLNRMLVDVFAKSSGLPYIMSGEDLCNQPIVPLQQDLCLLSVLRVEHAERNGHHYCGTLDHVSGKELTGCLREHPDLYESYRQSARLRIRDGQIQLGSLVRPSFGLGVDPDFDHMIPLADWEYESLGINEES